MTPTSDRGQPEATDAVPRPAHRRRRVTDNPIGTRGTQQGAHTPTTEYPGEDHWWLGNTSRIPFDLDGVKAELPSEISISATQRDEMLAALAQLLVCTRKALHRKVA